VVDVAYDVPPLLLLAEHEDAPRLRILQLRECDSVAAPVSVDAMDTAISDVVPRASWLAIAGHEDVWAASLPLEGQAARIARSFDCVPSVDPDRVWITVEGAGVREFREIDSGGVANRVVRAQWKERIDACTPQGLVVRTIYQGPPVHPEVPPLVLRDPDTGAQRHLSDLRGVTASRGSQLLLLDRASRAVLVDLAAGTMVEVANPGIARWQWNASFSPDGSTVAVGADLDAHEFSIPGVTDILQGRVDTGPERSVMVLIDTATGQSTILDGEYIWQATRPVWSSDGQWIVFCATHEEDKLYLAGIGDNTLRAVPCSALPPIPLLDAAAVDLT
jgi:hypothetical protein